MDTREKIETYQEKLLQSNVLVKKAKQELLDYGTTTVVCPKCGKTPTLFIKENRRVVTCECRFLRNGEIFF